MSIGFGGLLGSASGVSLSQTSGSETERALKDSHAHHRAVDANQKAEMAAGIGQTAQDQESSERDADGRRFWEVAEVQTEEAGESALASPTARLSKDATGQSGTKLDLTG